MGKSPTTDPFDSVESFISTPVAELEPKAAFGLSVNQMNSLFRSAQSNGAVTVADLVRSLTDFHGEISTPSDIRALQSHTFGLYRAQQRQRSVETATLEAEAEQARRQRDAARTVRGSEIRLLTEALMELSEVSDTKVAKRAEAALDRLLDADADEIGSWPWVDGMRKKVLVLAAAAGVEVQLYPNRSTQSGEASESADAAVEALSSMDNPLA